MRPTLLRKLLLAACPLLPAVGCGAPAKPSSAEANQTLESARFVETTLTALPPQPCGPGRTTGCYSNYTVVADLDGDGNLDIVYANGGNHFVPGPAEPVAIYYGDGKGAFRDNTRAFIGIKPSHVRQVAIGDVDGDGRLDVYFPGGYGLERDQLFLQRADKTFTDEAATHLPDGMRSRAGGTHFGDIDGDGDLDLLIADWGAAPNPDNPNVPVSPVTLRVLLNDGTGTFTAGPTRDAPDGSTSTDVDMADLDGDFDLDVVLTQRNGHSRIYFNDGHGTLTDTTNSRQFPAKGSKEAISFNGEACDIDGDGDLDLFFDGGAVGLVRHGTQILINDGKGTYTDETGDRIEREAVTDDNQVKCADVDNDGDFDLVVASLANNSEKLFLNTDGKGHFDDASSLMPRIHDPTLGIDFGDFDGDGRIDYTTAQGEDARFSWLNRVFKSTAKVADVNAPVLRKVETPVAVAGEPIILRVGVSDAHTSETGQEVREVSLAVKGPGRESTVQGRFVGGDLFRFEIPAQPKGTTVIVTPRATDRARNTVTGTPQTITIR